MDIGMVGPALVLGLGCIGSSIGCGIAGMASHAVMSRVEENLRTCFNSSHEHCHQVRKPFCLEWDRHRSLCRACSPGFFHLSGDVRSHCDPGFRQTAGGHRKILCSHWHCRRDLPFCLCDWAPSHLKSRLQISKTGHSKRILQEEKRARILPEESLLLCIPALSGSPNVQGRKHNCREERESLLGAYHEKCGLFPSLPSIRERRGAWAASIDRHEGLRHELFGSV